MVIFLAVYSSVIKNTQGLPYSPIDIHPENGNCNACQNVGTLSTINTTYPRKPKLHNTSPDVYSFEFRNC
jgi:hypothetical protein